MKTCFRKKAPKWRKARTNATKEQAQNSEASGMSKSRTRNF